MPQMDSPRGPLVDVVIGAGSGMGAAVARVLAERGGRLVLADRDLGSVSAVATEVGAEAVECDIADPRSLAGVVELVGSLGALVVTAGLSPAMADGRRIAEVNLVGMDAAVRAFEPLASVGSVAVCFASIAAHQVPTDPAVDALLDDPASPGFLDDLAATGLLDHSGIAYAVSKRGVVRLVQRRARIWGAMGARLVSVSPGIIDTPMGQLELADPIAESLVAGSAFGRSGTADEVAAVVGFLTSPAAAYITGSDVLVDGGTIAGQRGPTPSTDHADAI